jgi:hypothetical protein
MGTAKDGYSGFWVVRRRRREDDKVEWRDPLECIELVAHAAFELARRHGRCSAEIHANDTSRARDTAQPRERKAASGTQPDNPDRAYRVHYP